MKSLPLPNIMLIDVTVMHIAIQMSNSRTSILQLPSYQDPDTEIHRLSSELDIRNPWRRFPRFQLIQKQ